MGSGEWGGISLTEYQPDVLLNTLYPVQPKRVGQWWLRLGVSGCRKKENEKGQQPGAKKPRGGGGAPGPRACRRGWGSSPSDPPFFFKFIDNHAWTSVSEHIASVEQGLIV